MIELMTQLREQRLMNQMLRRNIELQEELFTNYKTINNCTLEYRGEEGVGGLASTAIAVVPTAPAGTTRGGRDTSQRYDYGWWP